jgi:hypothetical protein
MFFDRIFLTAVATTIAVAIAACSSDSNDAKPKDDTATACRHMNDICQNTLDFKSADCSTANESYANLSAQDRAKVDAVIPCIMAASACTPAQRCVNPNYVPGGGNQQAADQEDAGATSNTQDACEHINSVCANEQGFSKQDCSHSLADYDNLAAGDKQIADQLVPCVMGAGDCQSAFQCLKVNNGSH